MGAPRGDVRLRTLLLDTNIYVEIEKDGLAKAVRGYLDSTGWRVIASVVNLVELANAPDTAPPPEPLRVPCPLWTDFPRSARAIAPASLVRIGATSL